jgi:hypothetical protein
MRDLRSELMPQETVVVCGTTSYVCDEIHRAVLCFGEFLQYSEIIGAWVASVTVVSMLDNRR